VGKRDKFGRIPRTITSATGDVFVVDRGHFAGELPLFCKKTSPRHLYPVMA